MAVGNMVGTLVHFDLVSISFRSRFRGGACQKGNAEIPVPDKLFRRADRIGFYRSTRTPEDSYVPLGNAFLV